MECKNINGEVIKSFQFGDDGIVYGFDDINIKSSVDNNCCNSLNHQFDSVDGVCYWKKPCEFDDDVKILISPDGDDGLFYQVNENDDCKLTIEFDYLIELNCGALSECLAGNESNENEVGVINGKISNNDALINEDDESIIALNSDFKRVREAFEIKISDGVLELEVLDDRLTFNNSEVSRVNNLLNDESDPITKINYNNTLTILKNEIDIINVERDTVKGVNQNLDIELQSRINYYGSSINKVKFVKYLKISESAEWGFDLELVPPKIMLADILTNLKLSMTLDVLTNIDSVVSTNTNFETPQVYRPILTEKLYDVDDLTEYFNNSTNTGLFLNNDSGDCNFIINSINENLAGEVSFTKLEQSLNSQWVHFKMEIEDSNTLKLIENKYLKLGLYVENSLCELSILLDNVEFNRSCSVIEKTETFINTCPSFELNRVIDNKKSWVSNDNVEKRKFLLPKRETGYLINNSKLGINSKEIDINLNPSLAIESDFQSFIKNNPCLMDSFSGVLTTNIFTAGITINEFKDILYSELIDVKSRKTISGYPLLKALYDAYLNSYAICGVNSSKLSYTTMNDFISLIGAYWVDLIEQVIPSTTIWGSTYKYNNTIFDNNKFKYRKSSLFNCTPSSTPTLPIIGINNNVDADITSYYYDDKNDGVLVEESTKCSTVYISQINDGSEFIGSVNIVGWQYQNIRLRNSGDVIILNESESSTIQKSI